MTIITLLILIAELFEKVLSSNFTVVMIIIIVADVEGKCIIGFGDIDKTGYLDRLYVHSDYQKQGVATAICDALKVTAGKTSGYFSYKFCYGERNKITLL